MNWPNDRSVVLMSQDRRLLQLMSAELCAMGCRVFCARDFEQLADLVRRGLDRRFVLVSLGREILPPAQLREALARLLPEWSIQGDDGIGSPGREQGAQPPN